MHLRSGRGTLIIGVLFLMVALIIIAGCTNKSTPTPPPIRVYTPQTTILIESASVNPQILVISKGVTITWLNLDMGIHTITSDSGNPDSFMSPPLGTNQEFQFTFTIPGTYGYHCTDNAAIKGTIIVHS
jgi:plastocyanin